jgi:hypothetical protein
MPWWHMGEWKYTSTILDLGIRWRWVVSSMPRLLYPQGNRPRYLFDRRLGGSQSRYGCFGEGKILHCQESHPIPLTNRNYVNNEIRRRMVEVLVIIRFKNCYQHVHFRKLGYTEHKFWHLSRACACVREIWSLTSKEEHKLIYKCLEQSGEENIWT